MPKPKFKGNRDNTKIQDVLRTKKVLLNYRKIFPTVKQGFCEMVQSVPKLRTKIFPNTFMDDIEDNISDEDLIRKVYCRCTSIINNDFPFISGDDYPNTYTMTVRGDSFFFRTKDGISFSWDYDRKALFNGEISIIFSLIFNPPRNPLMFKAFKSVTDVLEANGWIKHDFDSSRDYHQDRHPKSNVVEDLNKESMYQLGHNAKVILENSDGVKVGTIEDLSKIYMNQNNDKLSYIPIPNTANDTFTFAADWNTEPVPITVIENDSNRTGVIQTPNSINQIDYIQKPVELHVSEKVEVKDTVSITSFNKEEISADAATTEDTIVADPVEASEQIQSN